MVALDNSTLVGSARPIPKFRHLKLAPLVGGIALIGAGIVFGALAARGFGDNGFRLGSQLAWRYACLVFFAALSAAPVCRLAARAFPAFACPESLSRKLVWGFCASYGVYLLSVFLPNVIELSAGATLMVLLGGGVAIVMAVAVTPWKRLSGAPLLGEKTRRALLAIAATYFWLTYALMALSRLAGPHRPDAWYGISLSLMIAALLLRYADCHFGRNA